MTGATAVLNAAPSGEINQSAQDIFLSLYPNRHQSILKPRGCKSWTTMSRHAPPLTDEAIINAVSLDDDTIWGCRWGDQTSHAVLDIDKNSQYHNELGLARLRHSLASIGLDSPQNYQSSDSEGWHLYFSFSSWVNCETLHKALKQWLTAEGYEIKAGQLEIFPSNNGLRLPLQRGFAWLDDRGAVKQRREEITADEAIAKFVDALDANAHDWPTVQSRITSRLAQITLAAAPALPAAEFQNEDIEEDGFSAFFTQAGKIPEVYNFGRAYWLNGLMAPSQRHHAIICIGHYLWYGDESEGIRALPGIARADQRAATIETWLKEKHNGFSKSVLRGDWKDVGADIWRACNWEATEGAERERASYPITDRVIDRLESLTRQTGRVWYPEDFQKGNIGREERAREQIRLALVQLIDEGRMVTVRGLERVSGCKRETIRRHVDIWGVFRLSNGLGDLSLGGGSRPALFAAFGPEEVQEKKEFVSPSQSESEGHSDTTLVEGVLDLPVLELAPISSVVFDSLRLKTLRSDGEQLNGNQGYDLLAATHSEFSSGVKHGRKLCLQVGEASRTVSSLNGFLPTLCAGPFHLPQTGFFLWRSALAPGVALGNRSAANFSIGASNANLTATGLSHARHLSGGTEAYYARARAIGKIYR